MILSEVFLQLLYRLYYTSSPYFFRVLSPQFASSSQTVHLIPLGNKVAIHFLVWYLVPLRIFMLT